MHGSHGARDPAPLTISTLHIVGHNVGEDLDRSLFDTWTGGGGPSLPELELIGSIFGHSEYESWDLT